MIAEHGPSSKRHRPVMPAALLAGLLLALASNASAMRFWWFDITRDGKPTFAGGIGASDRTEPRSVLDSALRRGKMQLADGTSLTEAERSRGDLTLEGEIVFSFPELEPLRLARLRIVHDPEPRRPGKSDSDYWDWRIHPADASAILRRYPVVASIRSKEPESEPPEEVAPVPILTIVAVGILALGLACFVLVRRAGGETRG